MRARKHDVHHARSCPAGEEPLHRGRHDLSFRLTGLVGCDQLPEAINDDVHRVAHFGKLFIAFDRSGNVKLSIERDEFEGTLYQLEVVAHGQDEIHPVDPNPLPSSLLPALANPASRNIWPDMIFYPRLGLVTNPARLSWKYQCLLA